MRDAKVTAWLLILTAFTVFLSGCGGGSGTNASGSSTADGRLEVSIMTITPSATPAAEDNPIQKAIEEATNSKLNIQWVANNVYKEKLNLTLASGDIPELIMINDPYGSTFTSMVKQGAFWDLTPYYKEYPNLVDGIPEVAWEHTKAADGSNYGIPRPRDPDDVSFFILRKDWLDELGLSVPTTTDELYDVMKAFVEQDPDGNGQDDTVGIAAYIAPEDLGGGNVGPILGAIDESFTGVSGEWKWDEEAGQLVYTALLPETREALEYYTRAYKDKLLPEDLLSMVQSQARDLFKGNKAGIIVDKSGTMRKIYADDLKKVDKNFKYTDFYPLTTINGYVSKSDGYNGILAIPKTVSEEKMKQILRLINDWMEPEVYNIQKYGIEGVHYTLDASGEKVLNSEQLIADNASDFNHVVNVITLPVDYTGETEEETAANTFFGQVKEERAKHSVSNISSGLQSETGTEILPDLNKRIQDLKSKIILGREPIEAWDTFVQTLKQDAKFIQMTEEMTAAYKQRAGL